MTMFARGQGTGNAIIRADDNRLSNARPDRPWQDGVLWSRGRSMGGMWARMSDDASVSGRYAAPPTESTGTQQKFMVVSGAEATATHGLGEIDAVDENSLGIMQSLLPPGVAWNRDVDSELTALLRALAYEYSRLKKRAADLIEEIDPRTTSEMIGDWERIYGLPDECATPTTLADRRTALLAKMRGNSAPTIANIVSLAEGVGYFINITEYRRADMFTCGSACSDALYTSQWMFVWTAATWSGDADEELECVLDAITPNHTILDLVIRQFAARTAAEQNEWRSVCWSPELGLFVAVARTGTNRAMTSPDGYDWTPRSTAAESWNDVCWSPELGLFAAVAVSSGSISTSPDGITWTPQSSTAVAHYGVCWSPELSLFVRVSGSGTSSQQVGTSPDGVTWTDRTASSNSTWRDVGWSPELMLFVAVHQAGGIMTSPDGTNWTAQTSPATGGFGVCWSPELGLFAVASDAGVMVSDDGVNWTDYAITGAGWQSICWSPLDGVFVALSATSTNTYQVATSSDGITWTLRAASEAAAWRSVCWSPELRRYAAVALSGTNRVMTA